MLIRANVWIYVFQLVVLKVSYSVHGLESVFIKVPSAVSVGSAAILVCECDLPGEDLYSVKWYKGKHEFFRFTSKEIPSIKIFPKAGVTVNIDHSNSSHVILENVGPHTTGKYSCEITEAAPSFHTKIVTRDLNVVDLPKGDPVILDMKPYYGADEFLEVECISNESLPAVRLEWLINERPLGLIQSPSRLEFITIPLNGTASSSGASNSSDGSSSKKSAKSSAPAKSFDALSSMEDDSKVIPMDSNSLQQPHQHQHQNHQQAEFTMPLAAAVVASATALSLTTNASVREAVVSQDNITTTLSGTTKPGKKGQSVARYEKSVSRLKLLLGHEHFVAGKIKVKCIARLFDLYERSVVGVAEENYPQVRVLSNSDNGVHFSFMSDKDEATSSSASVHQLKLSLWLSSLVRSFLPRCWTWSSSLMVRNSELELDTGQKQNDDDDGSSETSFAGMTVPWLVLLLFCGISISGRILSILLAVPVLGMPSGMLLRMTS
ncbi:uncharacterized protein LOC129740157 [Uranotaenia lowii]|uniref:uncharacterized protein LOC129740157 n=1 Tax=Uranotaenia lowii TaxID=190385 RepID=UPI0024787417|nr:uncharacterized protein LOC129740157 [Uranotaenia lowii]